MSSNTLHQPPPARHRAAGNPPRLGFLGMGWIGRTRLSSLQQRGLASIVAIADPSPLAQAEARELAPHAQIVGSLQELLDAAPDGVVIATPSALHATHAAAALDAGCAVFCQKPLGRTQVETADIITRARRVDRLLAVDLSYRTIDGVSVMRDLILGGDLGELFAANLVFHNAYGPDKPWFFDRRLSGGGCVIDLGIHLVDLLLWMLDFPAVDAITSSLFRKGAPYRTNEQDVEDYAVAHLALSSGTAVQLACSWNLSAGVDAVIEASFYGTKGGVTLTNRNGSFFNFDVFHHVGASRRLVAETSSWEWGGRAIAAWTSQLAQRCGFDPAASDLVTVAAVLDRLYAAAQTDGA